MGNKLDTGNRQPIFNSTARGRCCHLTESVRKIRHRDFGINDEGRRLVKADVPDTGAANSAFGAGKSDSAARTAMAAASSKNMNDAKRMVGGVRNRRVPHDDRNPRLSAASSRKLSIIHQCAA